MKSYLGKSELFGQVSDNLHISSTIAPVRVEALRHRRPSRTLDSGSCGMTPDREMDAKQTAAELFLASFEGDYEDEPAWDAVRALRRRNDDEVFQLAAAYAQSGTPKH